MFRLTRCSTTLLSLIVACVFGTARADEPAPTPPTEAPPAETPPAEPPPAEPAPAPVVTGTIKGTIIDLQAQTGLPAVTIQIHGPAGAQTVASELDGTFKLELPPGQYTLTFSTPDFQDETRTVTIVEKQVAQLDLSMGPDVVKGKEETIEIYDTLDTRKASAVLAERRAAATVSDAIAAEQISRSPDSNASDAAKRMVAATVQDNRYVVIRGLGGRYSLTLLNGVILPSPDPDIPAAPLDLFPASLLTNITVHKTFAPDMPGNFAGGLLGIETRTYPSKFFLRAKLGMGNDSTSSFHTLNGQSGGSLDMFGYDDGTRSLPSAIPDDKLAGDPSLSAEQRASQAGSFRNAWTVKQRRATPNLSFSTTVGDTHNVNHRPLGYVASLSFGHGYRRRLAHIARVGGDDGMGGTAPSLLQLDDQQGIEQANLGAVAGVGYSPARKQRLDLFALYSHTADITSSSVTGTDNTSTVIDRTRLQFLERSLLFTQLVGDHQLADKAYLEWQANVAQVGQHEPDTRDLLRTQSTDGRFAISTGTGGAERLFGELSDTTLGAGAAVRMPYDAVKLKIGSSIQRSARDYQQRRFHFDLSGDSVFLDPDQAFSPANAGATMSMYESTLPSDGYTATRTIGAAYAMADVQPVEKLRLVGGARFEASRLDVGLDSKIDLMAPPMPHTTHSDNDVLPSLNAVYALTPEMNLRAAYGMTVARPNFREIAPSLYYDYVRRRVIGGNPELDETTIHNVDVRWEKFLGDNEVLAASVFGKYFTDPIERTVEVSGDGDNVSFANTPNAKTYGLELEARFSLGRLARQLSAFSFGGNLSLIGSRIDVGGATRPLQGQSPYVANLGLGYGAGGTRVDLLYNTFGRRIEEVGTGGAGNVYEEPFHRLDLAVSQDLSKGLKLKLAGSNLLNQRVLRTQDGVEIFAYKAGVVVLGSLELAVE